MTYPHLILVLAGLVCAAPSVGAATDEPGPPGTNAPEQAVSPDDADLDEERGAPDAPARETTGPPPKYFNLDELTFDLGFESQMQRRLVRTDALAWNRPRLAQRNKEYRFEETLGLTARGNILGERVLQYDAMVRWGLSQERFTEDATGRRFEDTRTPHGQVLEYDIRLNAFPAGKVSATAYASRLDDRIPIPFLPSQERTREKYGIGLFYNDPQLTMRLTFDHLFDRITTDQNWYYLNEEEQASDSLRYEATWQPSETHSLNLEYEYERESDQYSGTRTRFDTTRNYFGLTDVVLFGEDKRSRLDTILQIENERGDIPRDIYQFGPQLRLQHTDKLFTTYKAQYLKQDYFGLETETYRGDFGITHQYEELLTTSLGLYGLQQDSDENADVAEWGGLANFALAKENRLGVFTANLSYLHSQSETSSADRSGVVIDEAVTFRDPLPSYLAQRNVKRSSILVRDPNSLRIFREGIDYRVIFVREYMALQRIATGLIADRQTVLVSYAYELYRDFDVSRDRIDLRVQQDFTGGLTPYYSMSWQDERIDPQRQFGFEDRNINRHRVGLTYRRPRWSAGGEYEYNDDSIDPYEGMHLNADAILYQDEQHQLNTRGAASYLRFRGTDYLDKRYTVLVDLGLTHRFVLGPRLEANTSALYRFQHDSLFGDTNGVDLSTSVGYRIGLFTVLLEAEYDVLDLPTSTDDSITVWLKVRREIPVIGRPRR